MSSDLLGKEKCFCCRKLFYAAVSNGGKTAKNKLRGCLQRNLALDLMKNRADLYGDVSKANVYFGDDDNVYDITFLNEIQTRTKHISMFNVGLIAGGPYEGPLANLNTERF